LHIDNRVGGGSGPSSVESSRTTDFQHKGMQCILIPHMRMPTQPLPYRHQRNSMICELLFSSSILAVKLNRKSLVIVLEMEIYIYDISNMWLLHVIETSPNPEGVSSCPWLPRESPVECPLEQLSALYHHQQTFIFGISLSCTLTYITVDQRRRSHFLSHIILRFRFRLCLIVLHLPSASIRRHPPLLHMLANCIQRHPGTQIPARLASAQLDRHPPCHIVRKGDSDPGMERARRGEAVSIPSGYEGSEDMVDEF